MVHIYANKQPSTTSASNVVAIYMPNTNMSATLHRYTKHAISFRGIYRKLCMCHIWSQWHEQCDQEYCSHTLHTIFYVITIYHWTNVVATLQIQVEYWDNNAGYVLEHTQLQHLLHDIAVYVLETNILDKIHTYAVYLIDMYGDVCAYMCHLWSQWHQPCDHEHCTPESNTNNTNSQLHRHKLANKVSS